MNDYFKEQVTASDQPQNNMEFMIDIESLGTVSGSPVVTIGAVLFDPYQSDSSDELTRRSLLIRVDMSDSIKYADLSNAADVGTTLRWWFEQSDAAIKALVGNDCMSVKEALTKLWRFCHERGAFVNDEFFDGLSQLPKASRYWAKDPDFDMSLMRHYYEHPDLSKATRMPWRFWECRSVRTVQDLAWPEGGLERPDFLVDGVAHDARWDAITQAMTVQAAMRRLGLSRDQDVEFKKYEPPK